MTDTELPPVDRVTALRRICEQRLRMIEELQAERDGLKAEINRLSAEMQHNLENAATLRDEHLASERTMEERIAALTDAAAIAQRADGQRIRPALASLRIGGTTLARHLFGPKLYVYEQYRPRRLRFPPAIDVPAPVGGWPTIAMVTPSFQQGAFIGRTIESVLQQNYPGLRYTVADGGSRDDTLDVLRSFGDALAWTSAPDRGQAHAVNLGFESVDGDIMGWLNSDDLLAPSALKTIAQMFATHPEIDLVYGNRIFIDAQDLEIGRAVLPPFDAEVLRWTDYVPQETMFWRRRVWGAVGPLDESFRFGLDWDFLLRALRSGAVFRHVPRYLGCFRVHDAQKNAAIPDVGQQEMVRLRERELGHVPDHLEIRSAISSYMRKHILRDRLARFSAFRL